MMSKSWKVSIIAFLTTVTFLTQVGDTQAFWRARQRRAHRRGYYSTPVNVDQGANLQENGKMPRPMANMPKLAPSV